MIKCCYWVQWLIKYGKFIKKSCWQIDNENHILLKDKFKILILYGLFNDPVYERSKHRKQNNTKNIELIKKQIISLKIYFSIIIHSGKGSRLPFVFLAIMLNKH